MQTIRHPFCWNSTIKNSVIYDDLPGMFEVRTVSILFHSNGFHSMEFSAAISIVGQRLLWWSIRRNGVVIRATVCRRIVGSKKLCCLVAIGLQSV